MQSVPEAKVKEIFARDYRPLLEALCVVKPTKRQDVVRVGWLEYSFNGDRYDLYWPQEEPKGHWIGVVEMGRQKTGQRMGFTYGLGVIDLLCLSGATDGMRR